MHETERSIAITNPGVPQSIDTSYWLAEPLRITEHCWPEGTKPIVSIHCPTYNHEDFIRDALEGFLMQETSFPVEILVHDDASTDRTADIIREYEAKYPQLFKPIYQKENQYSKGNRPRQSNLSRAQGEFIAFCEGDDFWITPDKLQLQVEILAGDPTVSMVFHNAWVKHTRSRLDFFLNSGIKKDRFTLLDLIELRWFMATASMVARKSNPMPTDLSNYVLSGDMLFQLGTAVAGDAVYVDKVCSVYRRHAGGISDRFWSDETFHYEAMRPNHIWMYWVLGEQILPHFCKKSIDLQIRQMITEILGFYAKTKLDKLIYTHKDFRSYISRILFSTKPDFVGNDVLSNESALNLLMDSECRSFARAYRKQRIFNLTRRFVTSLLRRLPVLLLWSIN